MARQKYDENIPPGHPSQDHTDRHPTDQFLRNHGFAIHSRVEGLETIWIREGRTYDQMSAVKIAKKEQDAALARMSEQKASDGYKSN